MREIDGFGGNYLIDVDGNVFSKHKNKYLCQRKNNKGYFMVDLYLRNKRYQLLVHRLVATVFIENPQNLPCVNHKDEDKTNNNAENLEWCTHKYNMEYSGCIEKMNNATKKQVQQIKNGEVICVYNSRMDAQKKTGISNSNISECCSGKRKTAGGFKWINA